MTESNWANASRPDPRELTQWVRTIRELLIQHHDLTGQWLTVAQIIERLVAPRG